MKVYKIIVALLCMFLCITCGKKTTTEETQEEEHHEETTVSLTKEQMDAVNVALGSIEMKNLTTSISVTGTLAVPNQNKALVTSLADGVLKTLLVQPGSYVRKGATIGTIVNTEVSALQQQTISLDAQIRFAEQEQSRQRELVTGNAAPFKNLQRIEAELSGLRAQRTALIRQLSALGASSRGIGSTIAVKAPISGTISDITAQIGSQVDANSPIAEIINNSELHLDLFVYEKDLHKVKSGQTIHFTLTNNPGKEYDASIYSIGTAFVNETKAVPVHAHVIHDKAGLIEGMSVIARISLGENVYPAVPDEAIVASDGKDYIFVLSDTSAKAETGEHVGKDAHAHKNEHQDEDEHQDDSVPSMRFQRVQVIKGASDIGYTEIKPVVEVHPTARIVVKGAFFLMAKMTNAGEAHEH